MKVRLSMPSVRDIELNVPAGATINFVKKKACKKIGIEPELTSILHGGVPLDGDRKVSKLKLGQRPLIVDYLWARHMILWGQEGQKRLKRATVLIAGAGAIGNEVAKNLAMLGVSRLIIVDKDTVELSNTSRMIFFDRKDQGSNKAEVLARNVTSKFPHVEALAWTGPLESLPLKYLLSANVIVCGLDNVVSRMYLSQVSRKYSVPMVDGGIVGYQGRVQVYAPPDMPCPLCAFPSSDYARVVGLRNPCDGPAEETKVPSLPTTISMVSSIQCQEATKLIIGYRDYLEKGVWPKETGEPLKGVLMVDLRYNRYTVVDVKRSKKCVVCGDSGVAQTRVPILTIPIEPLRDSASRLHETVSRKLKVSDQQVMLFSQDKNRTIKVEKGQSLKKLGLGPLSVLTAVAQSGTDYTEAIVRLSGT